MAENTLVTLATNIGVWYGINYDGSVRNIKENEDLVEADFVDEDEDTIIHFEISWIKLGDQDLIKLNYGTDEILITARPDAIGAILYA